MSGEYPNNPSEYDFEGNIEKIVHPRAPKVLRNLLQEIKDLKQQDSPEVIRLYSELKGLVDGILNNSKDPDDSKAFFDLSKAIVFEGNKEKN